MKKFLSIILTAALICFAAPSSISVLAEDTSGKVSSAEEVIYAVLNPEGEPSNLYAVVILNMSAAGTANYYGNYKNIKNLTDTSNLKYENGTLTAEEDAGRFYFQGDLIDTELPWNVDITYTLDGREVSAEDLAGAEGSFEIKINTTCSENEDPLFFDNYLMQVTVTLDADRCKNIAADGATLANSGSDKLATFTVMPGSDGDMTVTADVTDFEMDGISISAVPYSAGGALDEVSALSDGLGDLSNAVAELSSGASQLSGGAADLSVGTSELKKGAVSYGDGISKAAGGSDDLVAASSQILSALRQISGGLSGQSSGVDLSALAQLPAGLTQLADALDKVSAGIGQLSEGFSAANTAMESAVDSIPAPSVSEADIGALMAANSNSTALNALIENYTAAQTVRATWSKVSSTFNAVETTLPGLQTSVDTVSASLHDMASQINTAIQSSDSLSGLAALVQGMAYLNENYSAFHDGLVSYTNGVKALAGGWPDIQKGVSNLSSGAYLLSKGASELSGGIGALNEETKNIPGEVEKLTGALGSSDFEPRSFISDKNENTDSVQFVIKTDAIAKPAPAVTGTPDASVNTLWNRIMALFTSG